MRARRRSLGSRRGPKPRWKVALDGTRVPESSSAWPAVAPLRMRRWCARRFCSWPMSTQSGATRPSPGRWAARIGRSANGGGGGGRGRLSRTRLGPGVHAFSPSAVRAQVTALACTLPRDSGKPLSRWSVTELVRAVVQEARHRPAHLRRDHPALAPGRPHQALAIPQLATAD